MVIGRSEDRNKPVAVHGLLKGRRRVGTRSAEPIWAGGLTTAHRTYDRKQPLSPCFYTLRAGGRPHMDGRHKAGHPYVDGPRPARCGSTVRAVACGHMSGVRS